MMINHEKKTPWVTTQLPNYENLDISIPNVTAS